MITSFHVWISSPKLYALLVLHKRLLFFKSLKHERLSSKLKYFSRVGIFRLDDRVEARKILNFKSYFNVTDQLDLSVINRLLYMPIASLGYSTMCGGRNWQMTHWYGVI